MNLQKEAEKINYIELIKNDNEDNDPNAINPIIIII